MDMDQARREGRKLGEVREVLHRLQGLPDERQSASSPPAEHGFRRGYLVGIAGTTTVIVTAAMVLVFGYLLPSLSPEATSTPKDGPDRPLAPSKVTDTPGIFAESTVSPKERPVASTMASPGVEAAQALMSAGRVQAARQRLLAMAPDDTPEVAWALARSYDPNHLRGIQGADAAPDIAEATRWYRAWHAAAVKQSMITDGVSLDKIIGSMRP
jgi:hypothetical protein